MTRRSFLQGASAGAAACAFPGLLRAQEAYGGFPMGLQTYTLRDFSFDQTLGHLKDLGLQYAQFFSKQLPITDDKAKIDEAKEKMKAAGVRILSWGVQGFTKNADHNRKAFEFAKAMGFPVYSASPSADSFESLAALTKEYDVKIAIHNHGPEDKTYGRLEQVQKAVEKWPVEIGSCVDTGHVLRIGEDPVQWIKALGPRVHDVHLKDFAGPKNEDERTLGKGKLDVVAVLKALKEVKFSGILALEYERNGPKLLDDVKECLETVREAAKKL
ncbi:MAG: sugar phosphate isomerase/epimerase [Planctomycetaceae bacterium]|nr:sugar phosphate isomerase/epimerase [Planctomycetaceae bacterium]